MRLLTLYLTRLDRDRDDDDEVIFTTIPNLPDMIKVTAKFAAVGTTARSSFSNSLTLTRSAAYDYVMSLVGSLIKDDDPFDKVQVSSAIFPSVIYRVEDLEEWTVRTAIQDITYTTLNTTVS